MDPQSPNNLSRDTSHAVRRYDSFLGGHHNVEIDRLAAEQMIATFPDVVLPARTSRALLRRAVNVLVGQGSDHFLDSGSGIPTAGNVHDVAQCALPGPHVVSVDSDGVAGCHGQAILQDHPHATMVQADARQPEQILVHPEVRRLLDLRRPTGVLFAALLQCVLDDGAAARAGRVLREARAPGQLPGDRAWYRRGKAPLGRGAR